MGMVSSENCKILWGKQSIKEEKIMDKMEMKNSKKEENQLDWKKKKRMNKEDLNGWDQQDQEGLEEENRK